MMIWGTLRKQSRHLVAWRGLAWSSGPAWPCLVAPRSEGWTSQTICNLFPDTGWEPSGFTFDTVAALSGEINSLLGTCFCYDFFMCLEPPFVCLVLSRPSVIPISFWADRHVEEIRSMKLFEYLECNTLCMITVVSYNFESHFVCLIHYSVLYRVD